MIKCPVCDYQDKKEEIKEKFFFSYNNQEYKLYHCKNCDIEWWEPLKIVPEIYEKELFEGYKDIHEGENRKIKLKYKFFFKKIPLKNGKILDVGCGNGLFLKEAQKRGYEVWGIDIDKKSIKIARDKFKLNNTFAMSLSEFVKFCKKRKLKFDIITFFEVLEHQDNPKKFLGDVKGLLKPKGWIAGVIPNRERFLVKTERKYSLSEYPPHHFFWFSEDSLKNFFDKRFYYNIQIFGIPIEFQDFFSLCEKKLLGECYFRMIYNLKKKLIKKKYLEENLSIEKLFFLDQLNKRNYTFLKFIKYFYFFLFYPLYYLCFIFYIIIHKRKIEEKLYFQLQINKNE